MELTRASVHVERFRNLVESTPQRIEAVWGQKGLQLNISKVFLMFCMLSGYVVALLS